MVSLIQGIAVAVYGGDGYLTFITCNMGIMQEV